MAKFLVVGGAGYIGSHMVRYLLRAGHGVVVADIFSTGFREALKAAGSPTSAELDISDAVALDALFAVHRFDAVLHYFNAAGADPAGRLGERHEPETHLIPLVLQAASGRRPAITVFGRDYDTPDGTCIRDYIHVADLVEAHALALDYLQAGQPSAAFNLGNGQGFSVQEVIDTARRVTGCEIEAVDAARRPGDPPRLVADAALARKVLAWQPKYAALETIIEHAWAWERQKGRRW